MIVFLKFIQILFSYRIFFRDINTTDGLKTTLTMGRSSEESIISYFQVLNFLRASLGINDFQPNIFFPEFMIGLQVGQIHFVSNSSNPTERTESMNSTHLELIQFLGCICHSFSKPK
jgi:hypothetical protein